MNRLQKKCAFVSAGIHLLLLVILVVGPAFLSSSRKEDDRALLDFVPLKTIDEALSGGGSPTARPPAAAPPQPAPQPPRPAPQPQRVVQPPEPLKPAQRDPDAFSTTPTKKLPEVSLKKVTRKPKSSNDSRPRSNAADDRRAQLSATVRNTVQNLREGLSSSTTVEMPGPGGGGVPYANFLDGVKKVYSDAWLVPEGLADDEATATASVTIARDGMVVSARIIRRSGNALVDMSVEATLRRVTRAVPLPDNAKEDRRTVTIKFNVKAKRGTG